MTLFVTTLNAIREHSPCTKGWTKLLNYLNKTKADDEPLDLLTVLESNDLKDALWCLRAIKGQDKAIRLYAVWCARQVQHMIKDQRSIKALDIAEGYANGKNSAEELQKACTDAHAAAYAAYAAADYAADCAAYADAAYAAADYADYADAAYAYADAAYAAYAAAAANCAEAGAYARSKQKQEFILMLNGKYS